MDVTEADDAGRPHDADVDVIDVEYVAGDGSLAGLVRVDIRRAAGASRFLAAVLRPARLPVVVIDHELPLVTSSFEFRAPAVWVELTCESPLEHWTVGLEAFGLALEEHEVATPGSFGQRLPVGLDLDLETVGAAVRTGEGFEIEIEIHGEVLVGDAAYEIDGVGMRRRRWDGVRPTSASGGPPPVGELTVAWPSGDGTPTVERRGWFIGNRPGWRRLEVPSSQSA